jgi:hypothetical protein
MLNKVFPLLFICLLLLKTFKLLLEQFEIWNWGFNLAKGRHPTGTILCGKNYHIFKKGTTNNMDKFKCVLDKKESASRTKIN